MADLPIERTQIPLKPFYHSACDACGPFWVNVGRTKVKRWIYLFTCLTIRAIHCEVVHSLTTDSFLSAFRRFAARRGHISTLRLDNFSSHHKASQELESAFKQWKMTDLNHELLQHKTQFFFNPPFGSHFGGIFERMIRSIRSVLRNTFSRDDLRDEDLLTAVIEAEYIVNSRPLYPASNESNDFTPLTPNTFLLNDTQQLIAPIPPDKSYATHPIRVRWKFIQELTQQFWERFLKEYIPTLRKRQKWVATRRNLQENDLVIIYDEGLPRAFWPLARVKQTLPSQDGLVRQVILVTADKKEYRRSIDKLYLLEAVIDSHENA